MTLKNNLLLIFILLLVVGSFCPWRSEAAASTLGISGDRFSVNGAETFLLGVSYFDAKGWKLSDLDALSSRGFNLIRIFIDYLPESWDSTFTARSRSFFNRDGSLKDAQVLLDLVRASAARGIIVDATILFQVSVGKWGFADSATAEKALRETVRLLKNEPNVFFDLVNEYETEPWSNDLSLISRFVQAARSEDPDVIVTISGGSVGSTDMSRIISTGIDLVAPHFERTDDWADRTDERIIEFKSYLASLGRTTPLYLQEEARRGWHNSSYTGFMYPTRDEFTRAAAKAKSAGAAAWVFHTAAGFDLRGANTFFGNLDGEELRVVDALGGAVGKSFPIERR